MAEAAAIVSAATQASARAAGAAATAMAREDIGESLSRLSARADMIKSNVYATINAHYHEFVTALNYTADLNDEIGALAADVERVATELGGPAGARASAREADAQIQAARTQLTRTTELIGVLSSLALVHARLRAFDSLLEVGDYRSAAEASAEMVTVLSKVPSAAIDARILSVVRDEFERKYVRLVAAVTELFARAVRFDASARTLTVTKRLTGVASRTHAESAVALADLLGTLRVLGLYEDKLKWLARELRAALLEPLVRAGGAAVTVHITSSSAVLRVETVPEGTPNDAAAEARASALFDGLKTVFGFVASELLSGAGEAMGTVGAAGLWAWLAESLIEGTLLRAIPSEVTQLAGYSAMVRLTEAFELECRLVGLIGEGDRRLTDFVHGAEVHFGQKKRRELLTMARALMLSGDRNCGVVSDDTERSALSGGGKGKSGGGGGGGKAGGKGRGKGGAVVLASDDGALGEDEGFYRFPACAVLSSTQTLVEMAYATLGSAVGASEATARDLIAATRDLFELFRAVTPSVFALALENEPQFAMLFHNGAMYLAHHLLTLGFQFRERLPSGLRESATFIDLVPLFRAMGENAYEGEVRRQQRHLAGLMAGAGGWGGTSRDARFIAIENVVNGVRHHLSVLSGQWSVLPRELYLRSMGLLVDGVYAAATAGVAALSEIGEAECYQLHALLSLLLDVDGVFGEGAPKAKYIAGLDRFAALRDLFRKDLAAVTVSGMPGWRREEVVRLVRAVWTDSRERERKIAELEAAV